MSKEDRLSRLLQLESFLSRVIAMRAFQRLYFDKRTRERLIEARLSEARVDVLIRELSDEKYDLFG
jgi:hypothetical protein